MTIRTIGAAIGLIVASLGIAGAADAQPYRDHGDRHGYHDRGRDHRWNGHHRPRCHTEWRHHHRVRVCR